MNLSFTLNNILVILLIIEINPYENCNYSGDFIGVEPTKEKCFSLSYSFGNKECCFYLNKCVKNPNSTNDDIGTNDIFSDIIQETGKSLLRNAEDKDLVCPTEIPIPNNCGIAGIFKPENNATCIGISLVQGYCCLTKIRKDNENFEACIRTKQLNKDLNKPSTQIENYVKSFGGEVISVECGNFNLKLYWIINIILSIIYLY